MSSAQKYLLIYVIEIPTTHWNMLQVEGAHEVLYTDIW
jgi:hypothetical protein